MLYGYIYKILYLIKATSLDHQDANSAVLKFFCDLLRAGRTRTDRPDFRERADFINHLKHEFGAKLINCLIRATVFTLVRDHSYNT